MSQVCLIGITAANELAYLLDSRDVRLARDVRLVYTKVDADPGDGSDVVLDIQSRNLSIVTSDYGLSCVVIVNDESFKKCEEDIGFVGVSGLLAVSMVVFVLAALGNPVTIRFPAAWPAGLPIGLPTPVGLPAADVTSTVGSP